jgi:hypothetical protein
MNWDGEPSGYVDFYLKIGYIGSFKFGYYYLQMYLCVNLSTTLDLKLQKP